MLRAESFLLSLELVCKQLKGDEAQGLAVDSNVKYTVAFTMTDHSREFRGCRVCKAWKCFYGAFFDNKLGDRLISLYAN